VPPADEVLVVGLVHGLALVLVWPAAHFGTVLHGLALVLFWPVLQYGTALQGFAFVLFWPVLQYGTVAVVVAADPIAVAITATASTTSGSNRNVTRVLNSIPSSLHRAIPLAIRRVTPRRIAVVYRLKRAGLAIPSRLETIACASFALSAWPVTVARKSSRSRASSSVSPTALTLAVRGSLRSSAISPK
jgi:hypothetical protein